MLSYIFIEVFPIFNLKFVSLQEINKGQQMNTKLSFVVCKEKYKQPI